MLALIAPQPRHAHRRAQFPGLRVLRTRNGERTRNTLPLSPHSALATAARFRRLCDGYRLRATFLWLFPPPLFLRQCSAERYRIGRVRRRLSPNMTSAVASTVLIPLTARR